MHFFLQDHQPAQHTDLQSNPLAELARELGNAFAVLLFSHLVCSQCTFFLFENSCFGLLFLIRNRFVCFVRFPLCSISPYFASIGPVGGSAPLLRAAVSPVLIQIFSAFLPEVLLRIPYLAHYATSGNVDSRTSPIHLDSVLCHAAGNDNTSPPLSVCNPFG